MQHPNYTLKHSRMSLHQCTFSQTFENYRAHECVCVRTLKDCYKLHPVYTRAPEIPVMAGKGSGIVYVHSLPLYLTGTNRLQRQTAVSFRFRVWSNICPVFKGRVWLTRLGRVETSMALLAQMNSTHFAPIDGFLSFSFHQMSFASLSFCNTHVFIDICVLVIWCYWPYQRRLGFSLPPAQTTYQLTSKLHSEI